MMLRSPLQPILRSPLGSPLERRRGGAAFDPATLFGVNDRGGIYDLTTSANLKQLSGGTTDVSVGDPIGYVADLGPIVRPALQATAANRPVFSGMPRTLGSELAANGRFTADASWTKGTGWSIASGVATKTAGTASVLSQAVTLTAKKHYQITFNITRTAGTVLVRLTGGTTVSGISRSAAGSYLDVLIAESGNTTIEFSADAAFAGSVDNVSVKEVTSFVAAGGRFDGVNDRLQTAAIDLSNSDKATLVVSSYYDQETASRTSFEFGNYFSNVTGSFATRFDSRPKGYLRGDTAQVETAAPTSEGAATGVGLAHVNLIEVDLSKTTTAEEVLLMARGVLPTLTPTGSTAGAGNMANGVATLGGAANGFAFWKGLIHRVFLINRILTADEKTKVLTWARRGMAYCAVVGDSTVAVNNSGVGLSNAASVASFAGGMVTGASDVSVAGHRIADQKTAWNALTGKTALQAVFVQIGLNDVKGRVGANTATSAQVIADYQDLIDTINTSKPAGCKVYVSQMTPCKVWLDGATNPAAAYAAWQALNQAIAGGGATPITGVDGRITSHVAALSDGSDNLNPIYDHNGDGVHESNEGRWIIAQAWRTQLEADGLA